MKHNKLIAGILGVTLVAGITLSSLAGIGITTGGRDGTGGIADSLGLGSAKSASAEKAPNYLHTSGSKIIDSQGNVVQLTGINWFGLETGTFAPHGLWSRNWEEMLDHTAEMGFNTIRLPYSNQLFDATSVPEGIDYKLNPDLEGLKGVEIMDKIVEGAGKRGLKILLDRHRPGKDAQSNLWYTPQYSEERWISDWKMLAERYFGNDTVIGADLHNEPHGEATWGTGEMKTDWRLAAERAGNAILEVNPNWLIVVEGVDNYKGKGYWWGGDLTAAEAEPVRLNVADRLVYSAHDYGPGVYVQNWFLEKNFPDNMPEIWDSHWGYLVKKDIAPVVLGEFGGRSVSEKTTEGVWQRSLMKYLKENGISYTYWSLNPNSGDTGGVLKDDWYTVDQDKYEMLAEYQSGMIANHTTDLVRKEAPKKADVAAIAVDKSKTEQGSEKPQSDTAKPADTNTVKPADKPADAAVNGLKVQYRTSKRDAKTSNPSPELKVINKGSTPVALADVEIRYWYSSENNCSEQDQVVDLDWTGVGGNNVIFTTPNTDQGNQNHYMSVKFKSDAGSIQPNSEMEVKSRIHNSDWADFDQTNDYSFEARDNYVDNQKVTLYLKGDLVWGTEPGQ